MGEGTSAARPDSDAEISSPVARGARARCVGSVPTAYIVERYRQAYDVDVREYFEGRTEIALYECERTGYRFYHPASLAGRDSLYRDLGRFPWFYQEGKWEHARALDLLRPGHRVLDVGCGTGSYLVAARRKRAGAVAGIELNPDCARTARERGLTIDETRIEDHAEKWPEFYDLVSAFQVLEHVYDAGDFVRACLDALAPGGLFLVGVPNNDAFLRFDPTFVLNGPPHHMGLWTRRSLEALARLFPMELVFVEVEPLQEIDWYQSVMERRYLNSRWARALFHRVGGPRIVHAFLEENRHTIAGHTILAVFRKRG
jgi:2-polyprenyl-3-methyl-5-hydroxy-6-metoxy-1,4-benzoquinol methylase